MKEIPFHCGMNIGFKAPRGYFASAEGMAQPARMAALNINRVALIVSVYMDTYASTTVYSDFVETPADGEVEALVARFHELGIQVMLKPFLVFKDSTWQGMFRPPYAMEITEGVRIDYRAMWAKSFRSMLAHYAELAERCGIESICIGNEYHSVEGFNKEWREAVAAVRERFSGLVTSDFVLMTINERRKLYANMGDWWRELDFLSLSFYPPFPTPDAATAEIAASLQPRVEELRALCAEFAKPLVFAECGMRSTGFDPSGAAGFKGEGKYDGHVQGRFLEGVVAAFRSEPWWRGLVWWKWDEHQRRANFFTDPAGPQTFTVDGKPSADVLRRLYTELQRTHTRQPNERPRTMTAMNQQTKPAIPFMKGMNFGFAAPRGWYGSAQARAQIAKMKALNIDWVAAHVTFVQETWASTRVFMDYEFTPDDREVLTWIQAARAAGLKVMLKPILEPLDGVWRGAIDPPRDGPATFARLAGTRFAIQSKWVRSFQAALAHYVGLAAEAQVECLSLGEEYWQLEGYNHMWDAIIADARARYHGLLTYEFTPHGLRDRQVYPHIGQWWAQLDFLGSSAYGDCAVENASVADFVQGLESRKAEAARLADEFGMPLALLETGRRSTRGLKGSGADFTVAGVYDGELQSRYLEAIVQAFADTPWYRGFFWWKWDEHQAEQRPQYFTDPAGDQGFTIDGKPAAETLRRLYAAPPPRLT